MKDVFYIPQDPQHPRKGLGWVEVDAAVAKALRIPHQYRYAWHCCLTNFTGPDGLEFWAHADNPNAYGGRHRRRFVVYTYGQAVLLLAQRKLTIAAVMHFIRVWAEPGARVVTPGKRTVDLRQQRADKPAYGQDWVCPVTPAYGGTVDE